MLPICEIPVAYIDPATGAIVLQAIVAGALAMGLVFRRFLISPFAMLFGKLFGRKHSQVPVPDGSDAQKAREGTT
jgi:hypothetical protein